MTTNQPFDRSEYLMPVLVATGAPSESEAILLLAYRGTGVVEDKKTKQLYIRLSDAIRWNQQESQDSGGFEKQFREKLMGELKKIDSYEYEFSYTDELTILWAKVFPKAAELLIKSKSKRVDEKTRELVTKTLKP